MWSCHGFKFWDGNKLVYSMWMQTKILMFFCNAFNELSVGNEQEEQEDVKHRNDLVERLALLFKVEN